MSGATVTTSQTKEVVDPQKTIDAIKKGSADNLNSGQNDAGNGEETATILNGSTIKINIDDYMGDNDEQETSQFDLDDDSFTDIKLEDHPHNLNLVLKGFDKEFVKNKEKVKEELRKLFTDTIKVDLPSVYSPEGKNNYVYIRAKTQEDKKKILAALAEPTPVLTYKIQAKPCLTNNFAYVVVDDSNKDEALDLIMKHRNISYRDQLLNKSNEARQLLKATLDKFDDEIKTRVEKLERKYQPPHANVEKIVPLVPTQHYARECDVRIEINPANNEIVSGIVVTDKKLSTVYLLPLKYCIHIAKPLIEAVEQFISYLKTTTQLRAYNRSTGEGDVIGLKVIMNRACEVMITVELVRKSELAYGFVPLDPKEAAVVSEVALFGKKAIQGKRIRMRKNRPGGPLSGAAKTSSPTKTDSTANAAAAAATTPTSAGGASETKPAEQAAATTEEIAENDGEENKDDSKSPVKEDTSNLNQLIHLKACDDDSFDFKVTQAERTLLSAQVNNIKADLVQYYNQYKLRHGIVLVHISWVKVLGSHHFESAPFTHQIFKRGMLKDDYNGHTYDFNTVKNFVPRTVTFESLMRAVEDVVNFAKHPPENLALCTDYRYLMLYFAKKCKQLMVFHRWKCAEGTFRPQWWVKSGVRMSNSVTICFAQNNHGQVKEANKLFTAKGIPGTLITWGDMNLGIFARLVELGCKQVVMVFPKSNVFGSLGKYIKLAYPYLRLTRVITLDCQPGGELFSFVAVFQQATGAPPLKKIPGVTPGMAVASSPLKGKRPAPSGPPRPLVMDQGPQNKFPRRDFGPIGRPPMEGPPRGGNFGRDRYMDDRPPYGGPPRMVDHDPWMDNRGPPPYPSDRFERVGPPPSSYGPPPPEMVEPRSMGGGGGGGGRPSSAGGGPPAPDPNITSALNTLSVFMQSQLEFNKMLRTNIEKMSTVPSPSPAVAPPSLAASSTQASFPEPVAPPAPSLSRSRRDSPPPLMATKRAWAKDEPERETKRPFYGGGGSGGGRSYYDDGPSSGPADSFSGRRSGGTGSRPSTSDRVVRETRDSWDADVSPSKGWDSNPTTGGGGSGIGGGGGGRYGVEPASSVWGSRDEPTAAYTRDVRVKDEEPARPPRGGGGGGGFASDPRSSFGSLAAQRPAYTTPTSNWGASIARDRDSRPSGLGRNVGGSGGAGDRYGSSSDRFGSSGGGDRFGGGSNDRFGSTSDRFSGGGANRSGGSDRFGGSGGSISVDRYGGGGGGGSGGFGGGGNDDNRFGGGRSSWASGGGGSSGGRGFGNNSGEPRSSWGGSGGYNNSSSSFYK